MKYCGLKTAEFFILVWVAALYLLDTFSLVLNATTRYQNDDRAAKHEVSLLHKLIVFTCFFTYTFLPLLIFHKIFY